MDASRTSTSAARVLVIVPAHNEAASIPSVLKDLSAHAPCADVVVVDDASTDDTAAVARACGARVLRLTCNLGVGGAVQTGYLFARQHDYDVAVQFDGDGQHRANRLEDLVRAVLEGGTDIAIGSRLLGTTGFRFDRLRFIGSRLLAGLVSLVARQRITDPTSGFRASSRQAIQFFARHYPQSYLADTVEALVWASRHGLKLSEVPTRMRQRTAGASATNGFRGLLHTMRIILAVLIDCVEPPLEEWRP